MTDTDANYVAYEHTARTNEWADVRPKFVRELKALLNYHGADNYANTPDHLLAEYLADTVEALSDLMQNHS